MTTIPDSEDQNYSSKGLSSDSYDKKNLSTNLISCQPDRSKHRAIKKLKTFLRQEEKEEENLLLLQNKNENLTNILRCSMNMISDDPGKKLENITDNINNWIECKKMEMEMIQNSINEINISSSTDKIKKMQFTEKNHLYRESYLSVLFYSDKNLKSLYYLILTLFIWLLTWVMMNDYKMSGQIMDTTFWIENFSHLDILVIYWSLLFCYATLIVFSIKYINSYAEKYNTIHYYLVFTIYFTFQALIYITSFFVCLKIGFRLPCKFIVAIESTRISLKIHGYFREKMLYGLGKYHPNYVNYFSNRQLGDKNSPVTNSKEEEFITISNLSTELKRFTYYLFCPSLIYRDSYPRLNRYRWNLILAHFSNFSFCCLFYYILMRFICEPYFNFSKIKDYYSLPHFIFDSLRLAIPGLSFLVVGFFLLLHSWLNLWAELLRHGDRRFYEDWWNCTNFEEYYRKWNMVVHEWLYYYVYNDVLRLSLGRLNRLHAKMIVFALSVIIHELIMWIAFGFFFPILSLFFGGPGIIFTFIKTKGRAFNTIFWCKMFLGMGLIWVLYLREFNMRFILNDLGLTHTWHEWFPRSILMYFDSYPLIIKSSKFY